MDLRLGDSLEVLREMESDSVDSLVTDPPAGINFMQKEFDSDRGGRENWIEWLTAIMSEAYRVLKPGAHGLVWAIPRTSHWTATALENAGFEVRDVVVHIFGTGFPKSLDISKAIDKAAGAEREVVEVIKGPKPGDHAGSGKYGHGEDRSITTPSTPAAKQWSGWGTSLKPSSEHWILVRKPISEKNIAANVLKWSCGALNIDESRIPASNKEWEKDQHLCNSCVALAASNAKRTTQGTKGNIAVGNADTKDSERTLGKTQADTCKTAIGCSEEMLAGNTNTNLSTFTSGKSTTDQSHPDTSSTTSTKSKLTTELITCNSCGVAITRPIITSVSPSGRFPSNTLFSHNEDCEDACTEGCAVAALDEQSGVLKGDNPNRKPRKKYADTQYGFGNGTPEGLETKGFSDTGGASRFFMAFSPSCGSEKTKEGATFAGKKTANKSESLSIDGFGNSTTAQYLMDTIFITKTETRSIITFQILNASKRTPIGICTIESESVTSLLTESSIESVNVAENGSALIYIAGEPLGHITGIARFAFANISENGEIKTASIGTSTTENTAPNLRFLYCAKASKSDRNAGLEGMPEKDKKIYSGGIPSAVNSDPRGMSGGGIRKSANTHPTVKSTKLMEYLIRLVTPPGGTVLDPFMGSGSTLVAAKRLGFRFYGIELNSEYFEIAKNRIANA